jgi:hypothetical protein
MDLQSSETPGKMLNEHPQDVILSHLSEDFPETVM